MTNKLELKSCHEVIDTVSIADVDSIFQGEPTDPDILTVLMKDGKRLYCDEVCPVDFLQEEPVSDDLEEAAKQYEEDAVFYAGRNISDFFKAGAKWQKEQFEKNRLKHCNSITNEQAELEQKFVDQHLDKHQRMPTFLDAIEYGIRLQKEQMMAKAVDVEVKVDAGGYPYIPQMELYDYDNDVPLAKEGNKYKVILIKEE